MSDIPLLFRLPTEWLVTFLSEWLDLLEVGKLDMVVSSKLCRPQFLLSLQDMRSLCLPVSIHYDKLLESKRNGWWKWMSCRQIYIEKVSLFGVYVQSFLPIPSLRSISAWRVCDEDLKYLVRNCPALTTLELVTTVDAVTETGLHFIADSCAHLERLSWIVDGTMNSSAHNARTAAAVVNILHSCNHLTEISLSGNTSRFMNFEQMCQYGHLFVELSVYVGTEPCAGSVQSVTNFLGTCNNIKSLELVASGLADDVDFSILPSPACSVLEELTLRNPSLQFLHSGFVQFVLSTFSCNCKLISKLTLVWCDVSEWCLRTVAKMVNLKDLILMECEGLTNTGVASLAILSLRRLVIIDTQTEAQNELNEEFLLIFAEGNIRQTLECISIHIITTLDVDYGKVNAALASCRNLETRSVTWDFI